MKTVRISEIKQLDNGVQKKAYADHIYKWVITLAPHGGNTYEEVLDFCKTHLESAEREKEEYFKAYRDNSIGFNDRMRVVCGGYYTLTSEKYGMVWTYTVTREYID